MKKFIPTCVLLIACVSINWTPAAAQTPSVSGNLTASASSCGITASTACLSLPYSSATGGATITLAGTFSATVQFEALGADGATWVAINGVLLGDTTSTAVTSATTTGVWQFNPAGAIAIRARCSAFTSGTISVAIHVSTASA